MNVTDIDIIKAYYDGAPECEWNRTDGTPEFILTCRYLDKYIQNGDRVLDIGGGPGRYSLYLAEKGCDVTLLDLSGGNIEFAKKKASEKGLVISTLCGNALDAVKLVGSGFDHVLLMGPLYHLLDGADREACVREAISALKPGGLLFAAFISMYANLIYTLRDAPEMLISDSEAEKQMFGALAADRDYSGDAFTRAHFSRQNGILEFMSRFSLEKLKFFGQESVTAPFANSFSQMDDGLKSAWIDMAEKLCEREDLLSWSEHLMYIGRKTGDTTL